MTTYMELTDAIKASMAYDAWCSAHQTTPEAHGRSAFMQGYNKGFASGFEQGEASIDTDEILAALKALLEDRWRRAGPAMHSRAETAAQGILSRHQQGD